jgi:chorismate-pyruvate lyase
MPIALEWLSAPICNATPGCSEQSWLPRNLHGDQRWERFRKRWDSPPPRYPTGAEDARQPRPESFQRILIATDGTVTDLIALRPAKQSVQKLVQTIKESIGRTAVQRPTRLLSRRILLTGATKICLCRVALCERLSKSIQTRCSRTGRSACWGEERLKPSARLLTGRQPCGNRAVFRPASISAFRPRTYLIRHGRPLGMITEKWPLSYFREPIA